MVNYDEYLESTLNGPWRAFKRVPYSFESGTHFIRDADDVVVAYTWSQERADAIALMPQLLKNAHAALEALESYGAQPQALERSMLVERARRLLADALPVEARAEPSPR